MNLVFCLCVCVCPMPIACCVSLFSTSNIVLFIETCFRNSSWLRFLFSLFPIHENNKMKKSIHSANCAPSNNSLKMWMVIVTYYVNVEKHSDSRSPMTNDLYSRELIHWMHHTDDGHLIDYDHSFHIFRFSLLASSILSRHVSCSERCPMGHTI